MKHRQVCRYLQDSRHWHVWTVFLFADVEVLVQTLNFPNGPRKTMLLSVLLENINSLERAQEFAARINDKTAGGTGGPLVARSSPWSPWPSWVSGRSGTSWARHSWRTAVSGAWFDICRCAPVTPWMPWMPWSCRCLSQSTPTWSPRMPLIISKSSRQCLLMSPDVCCQWSYMKLWYDDPPKGNRREVPLKHWHSQQACGSKCCWLGHTCQPPCCQVLAGWEVTSSLPYVLGSSEKNNVDVYFMVFFVFGTHIYFVYASEGQKQSLCQNMSNHQERCRLEVALFEAQNTSSIK